MNTQAHSGACNWLAGILIRKCIYLSTSSLVPHSPPSLFNHMSHSVPPPPPNYSKNAVLFFLFCLFVFVLI